MPGNSSGADTGASMTGSAADRPAATAIAIAIEQTDAAAGWSERAGGIEYVTASLHKVPRTHGRQNKRNPHVCDRVRRILRPFPPLPAVMGR
jgi:hypothetical protein